MEGHDLERLLWPGTGSGVSTGLLQNFAVDGRHVATVNAIKSAPSVIVKQCRSSDLDLQVARATSTPRRSTTRRQGRGLREGNSGLRADARVAAERGLVPPELGGFAAGFPLARGGSEGNTGPDRQPACGTGLEPTSRGSTR
jgi:hypothetical protein